MPKIILNLRETILRETKRLLTEEGYGALSLRSIAQNCGVAVGTIYNYFRSKEALVAQIMAEDWALSLTEMDAAADGASSFPAGFSALFSVLNTFCIKYASVFRDFSGSGVALGLHGDRHKMLRDQIANRLLPLCARFGAPAPALVPILAETVISCAQQPDFTEAELCLLAESIVNQ